MPSPIGHTLAGVATAWSMERLPGGAFRRASWNLTLACAALGALPDIDLLYIPLHRTATHSLTAVALVTIIVAGVTRWVTGRTRWSVAAMCGAAYGSHLALDLVGSDPNWPSGIQALWPFSDHFYISAWTIFPGT